MGNENVKTYFNYLFSVRIWWKIVKLKITKATVAVSSINKHAIFILLKYIRVYYQMVYKQALHVYITSHKHNIVT